MDGEAISFYVFAVEYVIYLSLFFMMMKYLPSWGQHLLAPFIAKP